MFRNIAFLVCGWLRTLICRNLIAGFSRKPKQIAVIFDGFGLLFFQSGVFDQCGSGFAVTAEGSGSEIKIQCNFIGRRYFKRIGEKDFGDAFKLP